MYLIQALEKIVSYTCLYYQTIPDCKSGKCIQLIDPAKDKKLKGHFSCVRCIALDASESWLVSIYSMIRKVSHFSVYYLLLIFGLAYRFGYGFFAQVLCNFVVWPVFYSSSFFLDLFPFLKENILIMALCDSIIPWLLGGYPFILNYFAITVFRWLLMIGRLSLISRGVPSTPALRLYLSFCGIYSFDVSYQYINIYILCCLDPPLDSENSTYSGSL